jgi:hypothetical protein
MPMCKRPKTNHVVEVWGVDIYAIMAGLDMEVPDGGQVDDRRQADHRHVAARADQSHLRLVGGTAKDAEHGQEGGGNQPPDQE